MKKVIIPDTQVKPGVPTDHLEWIGKYILEKKPDVVVMLGDHFDCHSLSSYDMGKKAGEGARIKDDIDAGNAAIRRLMDPLRSYNKKRRKFKERQYKPRMVALIGNHEQRIERYVNDYPVLEGVISYDLFHWKKHGWEVHDFLEIVEIAGVHYSHYFKRDGSIRPIGGMVPTRVKNIGTSFTQGHEQGLLFSPVPFPGGVRRYGLVAGSCYLHTEGYREPQNCNEWRGIIVKHECHNGAYDPMFVSLNYLCKKYEGVNLVEFMRDRYGVEWNDPHCQ